MPCFISTQHKPTMAENNSNSNLPREIWLRTDSLGVYVRPQDIQGQLFISELDTPGKLQPFWDSTWDSSHLAQIYISGTQVIQIPGLLIVPKQLRTKPNLCWHLHWKRDENSPGLLSRFCALSPDEEEFFTKRRERNNQKVEDSE